MAVEHLRAAVAGIGFEQRFVDLQCGDVIALARKYRSLEYQVSRVPGFRGQQSVDFSQGFFELVPAHEKTGVCLARKIEVGRQFEAALKKILSILQVTDPDADFGQHAYCIHVKRVFPEDTSNQPLGLPHLARTQVSCGLNQLGMPRGRLQVLLVGFAAFVFVTGGVQLIAERTPGAGVLRVPGNGLAQAIHRLPPPPGSAQAEPQFMQQVH